jgi:hypothetical protein
LWKVTVLMPSMKVTDIAPLLLCQNATMTLFNASADAVLLNAPSCCRASSLYFSAA